MRQCYFSVTDTTGTKSPAWPHPKYKNSNSVCSQTSFVKTWRMSRATGVKGESTAALRQENTGGKKTIR